MSRSRHKKDYAVPRERGSYRAKWDIVHNNKKNKNKHKKLWIEEELLELETESAAPEQDFFHAKEECSAEESSGA